MSLVAGCPRCASPVVSEGEQVRCLEHGLTRPLWMPGEATYESFGLHLRHSRGMPTLVPWPLGPDWTITRFASVGGGDEHVRATAVSCAGTSLLDGPVEITVVSEEAGTGLGRRVAGTVHEDPGEQIRGGRSEVRVRVGTRPVPLWSISTSSADSEFDRSVFAGEYEGRWLWLVLRPASAALMLRDDWILADVAEFGPELVEMSFGGSPPPW